MVKRKSISPNKLNKLGITTNHDGKKRSAFELLSFNNIFFSDIIKIWPEMSLIKEESREQILIESQYAGYLQRQKDDINDFKKDEELILPNNIDYKNQTPTQN